MTAVAALGFQSCTDWDDHYDVTTDGSGASDKTLWEQISNNPKLSNFAALMEKVGYDKALSTNQSYTVWAPSNDAFDFEKYNAMSDSLLKAEFLNNHIARGYHRATGEINERVHLLNKKVMAFQGNGRYTLGNIALDSTNMLGKNGIIHLMSSYMDFRPNFYEEFLRNENTTSLAQLYKSAMKREIDKENSIEGPIKDGAMTYLDTVYVESNKMFIYLNSKLTTEDSTYTMIVPTDKAWKAAYDKVKSYYKYPKSIKPFTVKNNDKTGVLEYNQAGAVTLDADSLTELYTTTSILRPLIYSHTINPAFQKGDIPTGATDSIKSTTGDVICNTLNYNSENSRLVYDAKDLFVNAEKKVMSNGNAWITDSLRVKPWDSWCPIIHLRAQNGTFQAAVDKVSINQNVAVSSDNRNKKVEGSMHANQYYEVTSNLGAVPEVYFYIPEMWYTPYAVYLTMVPANITNEEAEVTSQKLQVRSFQNDAAGGTLTRFSPVPLKKDFNVSSNQASVVFDYGTNEKSKIVSKFMGVFNPSFCYRNLSNFTDPAAYPVFNIRSGDRAVKNQSAVLRIAGITLVPMEAVKYYQAQKALNGESGEEYKDEMPEIFWDLNSYTY